MNLLKRKIKLNVFVLSAALILGACAPEKEVTTMIKGAETVDGPITHGGETYRSRARILKDYIAPEEGAELAKNYRTDAASVWKFIEMLYPVSNDPQFKAMSPIFEKIFSPDHHIQDEIAKSKLVVKTFAPYEYLGSEKNFEKLYGTCYATLKSGAKQVRTSSTQAVPFADICIDAKVLAQETPTEAEVIGLISGHELLHHFGFEEEDGVVAQTQDFLGENYFKLKKVIDRYFDGYTASPNQRELLEIQVGDKVEFVFRDVEIDPYYSDTSRALVISNIRSSNSGFFNVESNINLGIVPMSEGLKHQYDIDSSEVTSIVDVSSVLGESPNLYILSSMWAAGVPSDKIEIFVNGRFVMDADYRDWKSEMAVSVH